MPLRLALLAVLVWALLGSARIPARAASGTTYVVQPGDTLGLIALTYGTSVEAIMQANGVAEPDMIYAGQVLAIPSQGGSSSNSAVAPNSAYTVQLGDTLPSIAQSLGVSAAALAEANGITNPDLLYVGQQLRVPGATLGSAASAPPASPAQAGGPYVVQPGDTLNAIAQSLGVSTAALADANGLTDADLLVVGQKLVVPGAGASTTGPAAPLPQPTSPPRAASGSSYVVQPGDTLNSIAASLGVDAAALAKANGLQNADMLSVGQELVIPGATGAAPQQPAAPETPIPTALPQAQPTPQPTAAAGAGGGQSEYVVQPGDTLNSIALRLGVDPAALARANNLDNADMLSVGQKLVAPAAAGTNASPPETTASTATPAAPAGAATPAAPGGPAGTQDPGLTRYTVKSGDTLGSIALKYGTTAAQIARANQLTSPDLVSVGMTLLVPGPAWTSPNITAPPSRFVASIHLQRCWLYQGNEIVADWPCSTGQGGTPTVPGSYKIQSKMDRAFGSTWNIWMPYWLGIYWAGASENGIHGIPYSASDNNWRLWEGYVGTPVTYGCVLLDDVHARQLYDMAYIGMPVIIQP